MQRYIPFDPIRDVNHRSGRRSDLNLAPITIGVQQGQLPPCNTIATSLYLRYPKQDTSVADYEASQTSTSGASTPEREGSVGSNTCQRPMRRTATPRRSSAHTAQRAKVNTKARKARGDRQVHASALHWMEDVMTIVAGYTPQKLQTQGNGRTSGLRSAKDEIQAGFCNLSSRLIEKCFVNAALDGPDTVAKVQAECIKWIREGVDMQECDSKVFRLHPDNILANYDYDEEICCLIESAKASPACGTHTDIESRERSKLLFGVPDARNCRVNKRQNNWVRNYSRKTAEAGRVRERDSNHHHSPAGLMRCWEPFSRL